MVIIKHVIGIVSLVFLLFLSPITSIYATSKVLISGEIDNQTQYTWAPNLLFEYPDGWSDDSVMNIAPHQAPVKGRFVFPAIIGKVYTIRLVTTGALPYAVYICTFRVEAHSAYHATIKLVSTDDSTPVLCRYTGDPDNNTAVITLTNNPADHP